MDVPQIIAGRFRMEREIGHGGMGTVYRAIQLGLERPVAVKIIKQEFAADRDVSKRFMREACTMARLRHQHAAMIFDAGRLPDGRHFIVMEYIEGETLSQVIARQCLSPKQAVEIASQICDVLDEAHKLGIIHRDLKPSNIMLTGKGVCVLDFGVAKVLATATDASTTHVSTGSGKIVGTPRYMAPEQCLGHKVGSQSDLYSLGVLLYEMLAGRPPFVDTLPSVVLVKQATAPPPPLLSLKKSIPKPLAKVVHMLLAKHPHDRPANAMAARRLLVASLEAQGQSAAAEIDPLAETVSAQTSSGSSLVFNAFTPAVVVLILSALLLVWFNSSKRVAMTAELTDAGLPLTNSLTKEGSKVSSSTFTTLTIDQAGQIARSISRGTTSHVNVVRVGSSQRIVAIHDEIRKGTTHAFVMAPKGNRYAVTKRIVLDSGRFRHATWTSEVFDADMDGLQDVLFRGRKPDSSGSKLVLYVPRSNQIYTVNVDRVGIHQKERFRFSASARKPTAAKYRTFLMEQVKTQSQGSLTTNNHREQLPNAAAKSGFLGSIAAATR